jgi:hypothetical protein
VRAVNSRATSNTRLTSFLLGMTRGVVPLLVSHNVQAISVGVNAYSCPPAVPRAFVWKDNQTGSDIIALWRIM